MLTPTYIKIAPWFIFVNSVYIFFILYIQKNEFLGAGEEGGRSMAGLTEGEAGCFFNFI